MPKFLTQDEIYRLLQRELPANAYPDGPASAFYSTADMGAIAGVAASAYGNLSQIYDESWPQTATEKLGDWEQTAFGYRLDASLSVAERRDRVLAKLRARKGITRQDMKDAVLGVIGEDKDVEIVPWNCSNGTFGAWSIGVSLLGFNTYLGNASMLRVTGPDACDINPADYGMTEQEWLDVRIQAYTYEVKVFSYTPTNEEAIAIDTVLTAAEAARDRHYLAFGLAPPSGIYFGFDGVGRFDTSVFRV